MGLCYGVALVMQLIAIYPRPKLIFAQPPIDVQVAKSCDKMPVSRTSKTPPIGQYWQSPPNITICPSSRITVSRVQKATRFWESLGHRFGTIRRAETQSQNYNCALGTPTYNEILIDIPSQDFEFGEHLGTTRTWWRTDTGEILKSKIEIVAGWEGTTRILEHELGHALGFKDNNISGHMMNRAWTQGGNGSRGLRKKP